MLRRNGFQYGCLSLYVAQIFNISKAVKKSKPKRNVDCICFSRKRMFRLCKVNQFLIFTKEEIYCFFSIF